MKGKLYVVATPIGNLKDITLRALEVLKSINYIACEDTRHTKKLLNYYGITNKKLISYHNYNEEKTAPKILNILQSDDVALVSDAGTPCISDPGYNIVKLCRENGIDVIPVPGASALTTVLSVSGLPTDKFLFVGFLHQKESQKTKQIKEYLNLGFTFIFYESPLRVLNSLEIIHTIDKDAKVFIGKELTKIHEKFFYGTVEDVINSLKQNKENLKGEFVIVVYPSEKEEEINIEEEVKQLLLAGQSAKDITKLLTTKYNLPKNRVYKIIMDIKGKL
ncbi:MAG: 16S rRNA (cytidine(1402)-2'-O)-methyltransferase [Hydrogenothermaceae bacterium]|nr:16S rRNA (cytidine(1402)-2'-O)-methyltransferase [Hydrogenothermaceae bacterium]